MTTTLDELLRRPGTWTLDADRSSASFRSTSLWGLVKVKGRFTGISGSGSVGTDGSSGGELVIDASSVTTGNDKRDTHLRSDDLLQTSSHPQITYRASAATALGPDRATLSGTLTIAGTSQPLEIEAKVGDIDDGDVTISASFAVDRSAWGIGWRKMGMTKMSTPVEVVARFTPSAVGSAPAGAGPEDVDPV